MPTTEFTDLAKFLRAYGLKVVEVAGWQQRSANWNKTFDPRAIVCHHTASPAGSGDHPDLSIVTHGRSDLPGPLAQFLLSRDGTVYVISGHRANHAGTGGPWSGIPEDSANAYAWGIEAENSGTGEKWGADQLNAYYRLCGALMKYSKISDINRVFGHKEWTSRKIDPNGVAMQDFRVEVSRAKATPVAKKASPPSATGGTGLLAGQWYGEDGVRVGPGVAAINAFVHLGGSVYSSKTTALVRNWQLLANKGGSALRTDGRVDSETYHAMGRAAKRRI